MKKEIINNTEHNFTITLHVTEEGFCCCPVCGFIWKDPDWRPYYDNGAGCHDICKCGFQFGYTDGSFPGPYDKSWEDYRDKWLYARVDGEMPPILTLSKKKEQLKNIGIEFPAKGGKKPKFQM